LHAFPHNVGEIRDRFSGHVVRIRRHERGGGAATTLASGQRAPKSLVVTATGVYWANRGDGTVMRIGSCEAGVCK
jgi:hypothetical protein